MSDTLTTKQVMERLGISHTMVYIALKDDRLKGLKIGNRWKIEASSLKNFAYKINYMGRSR
jgi:excisionase family DNA binding protein